MVPSAKRWRQFWLIVEATGTLSVRHKPRIVRNIDLYLPDQLAFAADAK